MQESPSTFNPNSPMQELPLRLTPKGTKERPEHEDHCEDTSELIKYHILQKGPFKHNQSGSHEESNIEINKKKQKNNSKIIVKNSQQVSRSKSIPSKKIPKKPTPASTNVLIKKKHDLSKPKVRMVIPHKGSSPDLYPVFKVSHDAKKAKCDEKAVKQQNIITYEIPLKSVNNMESKASSNTPKFRSILSKPINDSSNYSKKIKKQYSDAMLNKYEKVKNTLCINHLMNFKKYLKDKNIWKKKKKLKIASPTQRETHKCWTTRNKGLKDKKIIREVKTTRENAVESEDKRPMTTHRADTRLMTADLGVCIDQPFGISTYHVNDPINDKINKYIFYKNKAFAPENLAGTLKKIQSLENYFKNETISFSNNNEFKTFNSPTEETGSQNEGTSYVPIKSKNVISLPGSPTFEREHNGRIESKYPIPKHSSLGMRTRKKEPCALLTASTDFMNRRKIKSQSKSKRMEVYNEIPPVQTEDAMIFLESLVNDKNKISKVANARNRTIYKRKTRKKSQDSPSKMNSDAKKAEGFFCLQGSSCLKTDMEIINFDQ